MPTGDASPENDGLTPRKDRWRSGAQALVAVAFIISLILATISAANYTEIVKAKALTEVITHDSASIEYDALGKPESVNMTVNFTIFNPGGKSVRVWILTYKAWVRDLPGELGLDDSRDGGAIIVNGTEQLYFPVFVATFSFDSPKIIVPPESNLTLTRNIILNRTNYPDIMDDFTGINEYYAGVGLELEWTHYTSAILFIEIEGLTSGEIDLIRRFEGIDITPGVGGAMP